GRCWIIFSHGAKYGSGSCLRGASAGRKPFGVMAYFLNGKTSGCAGSADIGRAWGDIGAECSVGTTNQKKNN
ncbi:hypothetical protein CH063_15925, partial [Colletotrichum higginsianum]